MISKKVVKLLQEQIALELESSAIYMAMATWAEHNGFKGTSGFMYQQAGEERGHGEKIMKFLLEVDEHARVPGIKEPKANYKDLVEVFEDTLKHEKKITASIHEIMSAARENSDYAVTAFIQWFVTEQVEEEASAKQALDIVKMAGKVSLFLADKEVGALKAAK